ncbi:PilZ domain-containing protein [Altererythrobacter sp.]|uniref:PilZ domain-containing protein n=1 Tax=Altererythrobacter sp. TaxID=1872480 RepID=UPI003D08D9FC
MNAPERKRQFERKLLEILVEGRLRSRSIFVELIDVSEGGCKLKGRYGFAQLGETVTLKVDGIRAPLGIVVWIEGNHAGVEFEGQMHQAVIDHLHKLQMQKRAGLG